MKKVEDIEKMSLEELEAASQGIDVPEGLRKRMEDVLLAGSIQEKPDSGRKRRGTVFGLVAAVAAIAAAIILAPAPEPRDSFEDPASAYAQVVSTFEYISDKMADGAEMVRNAGTVASRPEEILNKINSK